MSATRMRRFARALISSINRQSAIGLCACAAGGAYIGVQRSYRLNYVTTRRMFAETVPNPPSKPKSYNNKNSTKVNIPVIMVDFGNSDKSSRSRWVCPSDRQLALRAKLKTGWSVKSNMPATYVKQVPSISEQEREVIKSVIKRAETIDRYDQQRVGRLAEKLENIKRCAIGNGKSECLLCAERIGFFYSKGWTCNDCNKAVCYKCGIETTSPRKKTIALCKICSETREMWKKSGAWFFKS